MAKIHKYGIQELKRDFPTDKECLELIFDTLHSRKCSCGGTYKIMKTRKKFNCSKCSFQIAPTAGTIFHKSETPLTLWFYAIYLFSNAKSGLSAKQLERDLNVTYKCAWRILKLIRQALKQDNILLKGDVEMDETYYGGKGKAGRDNRNLGLVIEMKSPLIGAKQRKGILRAKVSKSLGSPSIGLFLIENISKKGTRLMTDESNRYDRVAREYDRYKVRHKDKEFVKGDIHINNVESFWSHFKRSTKGVHKVISRKYLQTYLDAFVFQHNNRHNDNARFLALLGILLRASRS